MITKEDIKKMSEKKQKMIENFLRKFMDSRWREGDEVTYDECFSFIIVQEYFKQVVSLPESDKSVSFTH